MYLRPISQLLVLSSLIGNEYNKYRDDFKPRGYTNRRSKYDAAECERIRREQKMSTNNHKPFYQTKQARFNEHCINELTAAIEMDNFIGMCLFTRPVLDKLNAIRKYNRYSIKHFEKCVQIVNARTRQ